MKYDKTTLVEMENLPVHTQHHWCYNYASDHLSTNESHQHQIPKTDWQNCRQVWNSANSRTPADAHAYKNRVSSKWRSEYEQELPIL